jgi:ATP-dependent exoDNAse (exonuclease V) alpha subunit
MLHSEYDGKTHDYTRKKGIVHTEIMLCENAPCEYKDRSTLWNAVEQSERYKTAQLAREVEVALPRELTAEQNINLVRGYVQKHFVDKGMCADVCVHDTGNGNPHAHIMLTMRAIEPCGKWSQKSKTINGVKVNTVDWSDRGNADIWRQAWADEVNSFLQQNDIAERIDHRSNEERGIIEIPTVHLGVAASQMERKGIRTERGNKNREINYTNYKMRQLKARLIKIDKWLNTELSKPEEDKPPALYEVINNILNQKSVSKSNFYQSINNLKNSAKMLKFLSENKISDVGELQGKLQSMITKQRETAHELKSIERRMKTLDEHIRHSENYKENKPIKRKYNELKSEYETAQNATGFFARRNEEKARVAYMDYYENHRPELFQFDTAEKYLKDVLQERFNPKKSPPVSKWKAEQQEKTAERDKLYSVYYKLKDEVKEMEQIKRSVNDILQQEERQNKRTRKREMEL